MDMVCAGGYIKEYLDDSNITIKNNLGNVIYNREDLEKRYFHILYVQIVSIKQIFK